MKLGLISIAAIFCISGLTNCQSPPPKPECLQEQDDFHQCLRDQSKKSQPPQPDFKAIAKEHDDCFTSAGCTPPKAPQHPTPVAPAKAKAPNGSPATGSIGSPPGAPNDDLMQCFKNVGPKIQNIFTKCMQSKDPEFGTVLPGGGPVPGHPPPGLMMHGPPPPGGPPPHGGPPPGGPIGGPIGGLPPRGFGGPPFEFLTQACDGSATKAKQVNSCLSDVREKHKPSKEDVKKHYDEMCQARTTCKPKLGDCDAKLKKKQQYVCECSQNFTAASQEIFKQEPACAKVNLNGPGPGSAPRPKPPQVDCKKPPPDPCDDGFDKFYEKITSNHFGPPPAQPPPQ